MATMKSSRDLFFEAREEELAQDKLFMESDRWELEQMLGEIPPPEGTKIYSSGVIIPWWKKVFKKKGGLPF